MSSASVQSRIRAFEALSGPSSSTSSATTSKQHTTSSVSLLETPISPTASTFHPIAPFTVTVSASSNGPPSPSPPIPDRRASLVDLKDWIIEDGPPQGPSNFLRSLASGSNLKPSDVPTRGPIPGHGVSHTTTPLISFESPPKPARPPLPPRKPSHLSPERVPASRSLYVGSEAGATLRPPGHSGSLTIEHTYPPGAQKFGVARHTHAPASSVSSFHSISLSSDGSNVDRHNLEIISEPPSFTFDPDANSITDGDSASIADSFENVSVPSATSPSMVVPYDWGKATEKLRAKPPRLPQRPESKPDLPAKPLSRSVSASSSTTTSSKTRRPAPPPPPPQQPFSRYKPPSSRTSLASTSDRSSILSSVTTTSRTSMSTRSSPRPNDSQKQSVLLRPTPVPPAARARYESLFLSAILGRREAEKNQNTALHSSPSSPARKIRQAAGWRGLSVDLITNSDDHPLTSPGKRKDAESSTVDDDCDVVPVGPQERLNGRIVKHIWKASRLDRKKLKDIWNDCDPHLTGSLDRDAFIKGMWRIDEELRRAQLVRRSSALSVASSQRMPHRPLPKDSSSARVLLL